MSTTSALGREQLAMVDVVERLIGEYEGAVPAGTVMRCVARCRDELIDAGSTEALPVAVERLARGRLAIPHGGGPNPPRAPAIPEARSPEAPESP